MRKLLTGLLLCAPGLAGAASHNVILFVPDGLRAAAVTVADAPAMAALRDGGVDFRDSHSLFPTFTTANASAFATGHGLGDTGDFSNTIYTGFPVSAAGGSVTPFLESDPVLLELNRHFGGNYLDETSLAATAGAAGMQTALIGKVGPVLIQDLAAIPGPRTLVVDDSTGHDGGPPLADWASAFASAGIATTAPGRGDNGNPGDFRTPGTRQPDTAQQDWFVQVATRVVLPKFKAAGKPFFLVFWSRDPDGTQHNQGDSLGRLVPGINGPTSRAALRNADSALAALRDALQALGLAGSTDIIVAADHGFSTVSKTSGTSPAAGYDYPDVSPGQLPPGFLAIDLARALSVTDPQLRLFDPLDNNAAVDWTAHHHPKQGSGLIGHEATDPQVVVAANGGSDLIYLPRGNDPALAARIVEILLAQDYTSGVFVADALGAIPGTLPMSLIGLEGGALTPHPAITVSFRSGDTGCGQPALCAVEVADSVLQQGQGMHGSFSRADTWNFMAAAGPDFRRRYRDPLPASNADVGRTVAQLLKLNPRSNGRLRGRVLAEALAGGRTPKADAHTFKSAPAAGGLVTVLRRQTIGDTSYNDVAGFPGRTVGLPPP